MLGLCVYVFFFVFFNKTNMRVETLFGVDIHVKF